MCKRGNYFIAMYDKNDNNVMEFESIEQCARYFQTSCQNIRNYIFRKINVKDKFRLFKIDSDIDLNKSQRKGRI